MKASHKLRALTANAATVIAASSSVSAAAKQLGVDRSTVHRWIAAGKVPRPGSKRPPQRASTPAADGEPSAPAPSLGTPADEWATWARQTYLLDATEEVLVGLAVEALRLAHDPGAKPADRLAATARFQALVRQLDFEDEEQKTHGETATRHPGDVRQWPRRVG
jgi:hypothetical protein